MSYFEAIFKVLVVGLVLGAGLPALFATGMLAYSAGAGDDAMPKPNPALRVVGIVLFVFVALVILIAVAWITRSTIIHHFGVDLFPMLKK